MEKPKQGWLAYVKSMALINGQVVMPDVKLYKKRKPRAKETTPRNMAEKVLERQIILALSTVGIEIAKSGETSTYNSQYCLEGTTDLICFIPGKGVVFMEVKQEKYRHAKDGGLRPSQVKFRDLCLRCGLRHVVVYNLHEAMEAVR